MYTNLSNWNFVFKEKNGLLKFGLFFVVQVLQIIISIAYYILAYEDTGRVLRPTLLFLPMLMILLAFALVAGFIGSWYTYENTQAGIFNRETKALWEGDLLDNTKKTLKLIAALIILLTPFMLVFFGISMLLFIPFVIFGAIVLSKGLFGIALILAVIIWFLIFMIAYYGYYILVVIPSQARMIATNTFAEALKFSENYNFGKKHFSELKSLLLILIGITIVYCIPVFISAFFTTILFDESQKVQQVVHTILISPFTILMSYLMVFGFTYITGKIYRSLIDKEGIKVPNLN